MIRCLHIYSHDDDFSSFSSSCTDFCFRSHIFHPFILVLFIYKLVYFMYGSTGPHRETFSYEITLRLVLLCRNHKIRIPGPPAFAWTRARRLGRCLYVSAGKATCPIVHTLRFLRCCLDRALCAFALLPRSRTCRG